MAIPMPSVWDTLGIAWAFFWMIFRALWPIWVLAIGGKLLMMWLERWSAQRRWQGRKPRRRHQPYLRSTPAQGESRHSYGTDPAPIAYAPAHSESVYTPPPSAPPPPAAYVGYPADWDDLRRRVYRRAKYHCQNCGASNVELHAHHIVPLSVGGTNALSNLACLCRDCHEAIHPHMRGETPGPTPAYVAPTYFYIPDAKLRW